MEATEDHQWTRGDLTPHREEKEVVAAHFLLDDQVPMIHAAVMKNVAKTRNGQTDGKMTVVTGIGEVIGNIVTAESRPVECLGATKRALLIGTITENGRGTLVRRM